jgi:hypothetical protein
MTSSELDPSRAFRLATVRPRRTVAFEDIRTRVLRRRRRRITAAGAAAALAAAALVGGLLLDPLSGRHGKVVPGSPPLQPRVVTTDASPSPALMHPDQRLCGYTLCPHASVNP